MNQPTNIPPAGKTILTPAIRLVIGILLFVLGLQAWLILGRTFWGRGYQWLALLIILALTAIPPFARYISITLDSIRGWTARHLNLAAVLIAAAAVAYLYFTARFENIPLFLHWEDEFVYLIQAHMMAHGHLWMPHHPLARYFGSLYLITNHAYAAMYFPGTAIIFTPTVWLHLPKYVEPLFIAGISAGLLFRVVAELLRDPILGILAALMLVSLPIFRMTSTLILSQGPMLMLGLLMLLAYLRWRNSAKPTRWLIVLSIAMGLAAITRPIDAFAYAVLIAAAMICDLRHKPLKTWIKSAAILIPIVLAFLTIQLIFNIGVTGHWNQTPYGDYMNRQFPGVSLGFSSPSANALPESDLPQIRHFYRDFVLPTLATRQQGNLLPDFFTNRLPMLWDFGFPDLFLWILVPFSCLALFKYRAWVVWAVLPLAMLGYLAWSFIPHYVVPFLPSIILILLLSIPAAVTLFPRQAHRAQCAIVLSILTLSIMSLPQFDRTIHDTHFHPFELQQINSQLRQLHSPAIVLFHYHNGDIVNGHIVVNSIESEPVYNSDVPWPDDAPIIRAHDRNANISSLGTPADQDRPLYLYYAKIDPNRIVYLYDRLFPYPCHLQPLGSVADLANATAPSTTPAP